MTNTHIRPLHRLLTILAASIITSSIAVAQQASMTPPAALGLENVPPIPLSLAAEVAKYTEFKPIGLADWHPTRLEMLVSQRHKNTTQIYRLPKPGAALELLTDYPEPVRNATYQPTRGDYLLFGKDSGGNEVFRLYRQAAELTAANQQTVAISADNQRVQAIAWSNRGDRLVYTTVPVNRKGSSDTVQSEVHIASLNANPGKDQIIASLPGGGWSEFAWSPDDKRLAFVEYVSANESYIWLMDIDLRTKRHTTLTKDIPWDVDSFDLSRDGKLLAFVSNEDGTDVLHLMRTSDRKPLPTPKLPLGTVGGVKWHRDSTNIAITVSSAKGPAEVYSFNVKTAKLTRWTQHEPAGADPATFVEPDLVRWKSFDDHTISGFIYRAPSARFPGKRPVYINIHGGPEGQFRPGFMSRNNYYTSEMGITVIYPNVRGSSGYGKSFLKLDNGRLREDSVKDIGALFDWIAAQPDLDASRVMVAGGSYGGYMSLAVSTLYPERIAASIDVVGISNFVTFLENTESYRRDLRRVEYGDERDPEMRKFLESISPLNRAAQIKKPLFVVQGKNDPRVPYTEAEQIVATLKKGGTPVWYMVAADEGHGFAKKANADYQFYATIEFMRRYLLDNK